MRNHWITLMVMLAAAGTAFGVFYVMNDEPAVRQAAREGDAMAWLRAEFHLNDAEFAAIKRLHDEYGVACARHCTEIMAARRRIAAMDAGSVAREKAVADEAALERKCVEAMTEHFQKVAALMPEGEGARYLAIVLPRVHGYSHEGAPTLRLEP